MPTDDFPSDPPQPQPPVPPHAVSDGRWPAWVVNGLIYVQGFAAIWVMMAVILLVWCWLLGPTTIGNPATPP
jgi:hypothetical protein